VKTIRLVENRADVEFAKAQAAAKIHWESFRFWDKATLNDIMTTCVICKANKKPG
jgi:hypothetical protein